MGEPGPAQPNRAGPPGVEGVQGTAHPLTAEQLICREIENWAAKIDLLRLMR
jgi:hypothetical protein